MSSRIFLKLFLFSFLLLLYAVEAVAVINVPEITNPHPRMYCTQTDISRIQGQISTQREPWYSAWLYLNNISDVYLGYTPEPYTGPNSLDFYNAAIMDSGYCRDLALTYLITSDTTYANKAKNFLLAWASAIPTPASAFDPAIRYPNSGMEIGRSPLAFTWAYDLLYNYESFTESEKATVEEWFRVLEVVIKEGINRWEINDYFGHQYCLHKRKVRNSNQ